MLIENQLKKLGFGTAAIFLLIVAVLLGAPQMYLMAIVIGLIPIVAVLMNRFLMRGLSCRRRAPDTGDERGRMTVSLTIENTGPLPKFHIRVGDALPRYLRYAGSPADTSSFIGQLWPGESRRIQYFVEPQRRGAHCIGPIRIRSSDLFGFTDLNSTIHSTNEVLVYPEILPVTPSLLSSGAATGWRDEVDAKSRGNGTDFTGVREYRVGDELRRINWKTTARTGDLAVTEYTQGYASDVTIILDREASAYVGSGSGPVSAFEYAVKIATTLGASAMRQGSVVKLYAMGSPDDSYVEIRAAADLALFLDRLARIEADGAVTLLDQLGIATSDRLTSATFVIISPRSADEDVRTALGDLNRLAVGSAVHAFWLDAPTFADSDERLISTQARSPRALSGASYGKTATDIGTEYVVGATSNLIALMGDTIG